MLLTFHPCIGKDLGHSRWHIVFLTFLFSESLSLQTFLVARSDRSFWNGSEGFRSALDSVLPCARVDVVFQCHKRLEASSILAERNQFTQARHWETHDSPSGSWLSQSSTSLNAFCHSLILATFRLFHQGRLSENWEFFFEQIRFLDELSSK